MDVSWLHWTAHSRTALGSLKLLARSFRKASWESHSFQVSTFAVHENEETRWPVRSRSSEEKSLAPPYHNSAKWTQIAFQNPVWSPAHPQHWLLTASCWLIALWCGQTCTKEYKMPIETNFVWPMPGLNWGLQRWKECINQLCLIALLLPSSHITHIK